MFENENDRKVHTGYHLSKIKIKDYNAMIYGEKKLFWSAGNNDLRTYENIQKIARGQRGNNTAACLLDYNYFKEHYKLIAIDLGK